MGLSCVCDDFDKSEHNRWFEQGFSSYARYGETCCECDAIIHKNGEEKFKQRPIIEYEVFVPDEPEPNEDNEEELEKFRNKHGYEWEYERYERIVCKHFRCERCIDLVESIEELGYCMIIPGEMIECHVEYVYEHSEKDIKWKKDGNGVYQPSKLEFSDHARRFVNTIRFKYYNLRYALMYKRYRIQYVLKNVLTKFKKFAIKK